MKGNANGLGSADRGSAPGLFSATTDSVLLQRCFACRQPVIAPRRCISR